MRTAAGLAGRHVILLLLTVFYAAKAPAISHLDQYLQYRSEGKHKSARSILNKWDPKSFEEKSYKKYFLAINENSTAQFWQLYQELAKNKKLLKLQHDSLMRILEIDLNAKGDTTGPLKGFDRAAKKMLANLRAQPEGFEYELLYLKWTLKNKNLDELCKTERMRWLSQTSLSLSEAVLGLESCPMTFKDFTYRVRMLIFAGEEAKAQAEIKEFIALRPLEEWEKAYLQASFYTNVGDPTAAFETISPFGKELKAGEDFYGNYFFMAIRAGETKEAEQAVNHIIATAKSVRQRREYSYQKAFLYYQNRRYKEAVKILNSLITTHGSHRRKVKTRDYDELTWLRAWCYYLDKDAEKARDALLENQKWARDKARNLYWLAQAEWGLDNRVTAVEHFRQLAEPVLKGEFFSYYNYLAWLRYESYKGFATSDLVRAHLSNIRSGRGFYAIPDSGAHPLDMVENYESQFDDVGATDEGTEENAVTLNEAEQATDERETKGLPVYTSAELKNEMSWADDLIKWGFRDLAKWHLYEIEKTLTRSSLTNKAQAEPLIQYYLDKEYYNRSLSLANSVNPPFGKKLSLKDNALLWQSLYPRAYSAEVEKQAKKRKIHPYLLWAIMKAETQYKYDAISPVGAMGLMQFMPYTSQKVAVMLKEDHDVEDLFRPEPAIKYGAMYLRKLSDELGGQFPLVAAAYNGGPHRVKLWLRNLKDKDGGNMEYDVFIEHIPFNETRTYVKRVLSYILTYQKLYEDKSDYAGTKWLIEKNPFRLQEPIVLKEVWPFEREIATQPKPATEQN